MVTAKPPILTAWSVLLLTLVAAAPARAWERTAPYDGLRFTENEAVQVRHEGQWRLLVAIDGKPTSELLAASREAFGDTWEKRFVEDLVEVMTEAGVAPGATVSLSLGDLATGAVTVIPDVPMTHDKRQVLWRERRGRRAGR